MKNLKGITLIELVVVIAIIGILLGVTMSRMVGTSHENELEMAANLVQSTLGQAREMARSPKPSGSISDNWDINGYGVVFNIFDSKTRFSIFSDAIDSNNPGHQNRWINPNNTLIDDKIIKTYDFLESQIKNVEMIKYKINGVECVPSNIMCGLDSSIFFSYSENPQQEKVYFQGLNTYNYVSVILKNKSGKEKEVRVNFSSGIIEII